MPSVNSGAGLPPPIASHGTLCPSLQGAKVEPATAASCRAMSLTARTFCVISLPQHTFWVTSLPHPAVRGWSSGPTARDASEGARLGGSLSRPGIAQGAAAASRSAASQVRDTSESRRSLAARPTSYPRSRSAASSRATGTPATAAPSRCSIASTAQRAIGVTIRGEGGAAVEQVHAVFVAGRTLMLSSPFFDCELVPLRLRAPLTSILSYSAVGEDAWGSKSTR